jgi:hypothetical protein
MTSPGFSLDTQLRITTSTTLILTQGWSNQATMLSLTKHGISKNHDHPLLNCFIIWALKSTMTRCLIPVHPQTTILRRFHPWYQRMFLKTLERFLSTVAISIYLSDALLNQTLLPLKLPGLRLIHPSYHHNVFKPWLLLPRLLMNTKLEVTLWK